MIVAEPRDIDELMMRCKIAYPERNVEAGSKIMARVGKHLIGPFTVDAVDGAILTVTAAPNFNYYVGTHFDNIDENRLIPICSVDYKPVTNNVCLDGFLRAAYYDDLGLIKVEISEEYTELLAYYCNLMEYCGIQFHNGKNCIILEDEKVIQEIFRKQTCEFMPLGYILGYLSSYAFFAKLETRGNEQRRYSISVPVDYIDRELITESMFLMNLKGCVLIPTIFTSLEPLSKIIESLQEEKNLQHPEPIHMTIIRNEVFPNIVHKLFYYAGYEITRLRPIEPGTYSMDVKSGESFKRVAMRADGRGIVDESIDYMIDGNLNIVQLEDGKASGREEELLYSRHFHFRNELCDYFKALYNRL